MEQERETLIRARAQEIWENEGRPEGAHDRHWHQAAQEVDTESERDVRPVDRDTAVLGNAQEALGSPVPLPPPD